MSNKNTPSEQKLAKTLLESLVKIPSYNDSTKPSYQRNLLRFLEKYIRQNFKTFLIEKVYYGKNKYNLICSSRTTTKKSLFLCHVDTVPPVDNGPLGLTVKADKLYGLGTKDMKGGIVSVLLALHKVVNGECSIVFYGDEESTQSGIRALINNIGKIPNADLIISPESRFNIGYGSRGVVVIKLSVAGKTASTARNFQGVDAIQLFCGVGTELQKFLSKKTTLGKSSVTITDIKGGLRSGNEFISQPNMLANYCTGSLSIRLARQDISTYEIVKVIRKKTTKLRGRIDDIEILKDYPAYLVSKSKAKRLIEAIKKNNYKVEYADPSLSGYNDVSLLAKKLNKPLVNFGPYGEGNHSSKEWVSLKSIVKTSHIYAELM